MSDSAPAPMAYPAIASRRMARRLLAGAGTAAIAPYQLAPELPPLMVMHALDDGGRVIVAALPAAEHPLAAVPCGEATAVRMDVELESAEAGVRVATASCHLLGNLTWLDDVAATQLLAGSSAACHCPLTGDSPLVALAELAGAAGGRLGVVLTDRVTVHDPMGVGGHSIAQVLDPASDGAGALLWSQEATASAQEEVCALGQIALDLLVSGVRCGHIPGFICSVRPSFGLCAKLEGRVLCVDVSPYGVTLMRLGALETETVQLLLPPGTKHPAQVGQHLGVLASEAVVAGLLGA
ncbi:Uncharacterised protein [Actinomyces bovis]|uniref:Uncharacterized protein n=1 Tax=Actinomyces bovis TaxID=1658 RepID=A0ABY1VMR8_9ACTO|nr:hypothetical protein [Actinomyces bovis]SPT52767.1 Uncharacterised protein [Actinomyces bovis]VEG54779.1 Uncharacterised protein [Actinomyces israelii]